MLNPVDFSGRPFHFIGIGGIGMSAIAYILAKQGFTVSGSDLSSNPMTAKLTAAGAKVYRGHDANHIEPGVAPQVVCSTAINAKNPEYQAAVDLGLPILHRSDMLAALISQFKSIAVAGTHGKTTTSSLIGFLLLKTGVDPTIVIGGEVSAWEGNARIGQSEYLVAEADESDGTLVKFLPYLGVITNIELDHPDHYTSLEQVVEIFSRFAQQCQVVVGSLDCPNIKKYFTPQITYSLNDPSATYTVQNVEYADDVTIATVLEEGQVLGEMRLSLLGQHNLSNALAAIAVARHLGVAWSAIAEALPEFGGARRRFEIKGQRNGITFVDDYAHHPSEIIATLTAARQRVSYKRIVAIFQPHRYSRTRCFLSEFSQSFSDADLVVVTDIYAASEPIDPELTGATVVAAIAEHHSAVTYQPQLADVQKFLGTELQSGDLALFLGAGNLNQIIAPTLESLSE
ncbi:MAG: UDP-N-acetylmuramate--L-alanine ligase [Pseudanabaenaceae cyanobacterium]